jgi:hypothetical protein
VSKRGIAYAPIDEPGHVTVIINRQTSLGAAIKP